MAAPRQPPGLLDVPSTGDPLTKLSTVEELATRVRKKIESGELPPGARLPTTLQLAQQWETYVPAVHAALVALTKEGLLDRRHRKGTYVREPESRLSRVGILAPQQLWEDNSEYYFIREVFLMLEDHLLQQNVRTTVWFETRRAGKASTPIPSLEQAARKSDIQALIVLNAGLENAPWLDALTIPVNGIGHGLKNRVDFNFDLFFSLAFRTLRQAGCRSAALISGKFDTDTAHFEAFQREAAKQRIKILPRWIRSCTPDAEPFNDFGYREFRSLWNEAGRPEGLIAYPDVVARGVMVGLSMTDVKIPDELSVVFHKNAEVPFACPLPVHFAVSSCKDLAHALYQQLMGIREGQSCARLLTDFYQPPSPPKEQRTPPGAKNRKASK